MILMRRGERTCECLVIALLTAITYVYLLRKSLKHFIARYMSYSYLTIISCFRNDLQGNDELLATQALLVNVQRLLNS